MVQQNAVLGFKGDNNYGKDFLQDWGSFNRMAVKKNPQAVPIKTETLGDNEFKVIFDWNTLLHWFDSEGDASLTREEKAREFLLSLGATARDLFDMKCTVNEMP